MLSIFPYAYIILHLVTMIYLLKVAFWNLALLGILLQWFFPGHFLRASVLDLWLLRALQHLFYDFPADSVIKNPPAVQETCRRHGFDPWVRKLPWWRKWQSIPIFLPGKSHEQRSLMGCSPQGHTGSDVTEQLNSSSTCFNVHMLIWTS